MKNKIKIIVFSLLLLIVSNNIFAQPGSTENPKPIYGLQAPLPANGCFSLYVWRPLTCYNFYPENTGPLQLIAGIGKTSILASGGTPYTVLEFKGEINAFISTISDFSIGEGGDGIWEDRGVKLYYHCSQASNGATLQPYAPCTPYKLIQPVTSPPKEYGTWTFYLYFDAIQAAADAAHGYHYFNFSLTASYTQ